MTLTYVKPKLPVQDITESPLLAVGARLSGDAAWAHEQLKIRCARLRKMKLNVQSRLLKGTPPARMLESFINEGNFDLVIMGTHGRAGLKHFVPGTVAQEMVRISPVPVLTIHRTVREYLIKRILVPVDFSTFSAQAAECAISIARKFDSKLVFIHVIEQEINPHFFSDASDYILGMDSDLEELVHDNLRAFVNDLGADTLMEDLVIKRGVAHREITEHAWEEKFDLVVISTRGQSGLEYVVMGNTAEEVTRWARCPVLAVRPVE